MPALFLTPGHLFRPLPTLYFSRPPYFFTHALAYKASFFRLARPSSAPKKRRRRALRTGGRRLFLHRSGHIFYTGAGHFFLDAHHGDSRVLRGFCIFLGYISPYFYIFLDLFTPVYFYIYTHIYTHICPYKYTHAYLWAPIHA